eukprot:TRINITY_DN12489_c0_g1_i1.p1 TRINITY_DN12489_c0_g1~~TRINITY_DN12489_c0_g1_i1.p1  ORF type:complete len:725 (+),score=191.78 TRINITY_DN12489_c0_g1_i1:124-2298(+)
MGAGNSAAGPEDEAAMQEHLAQMAAQQAAGSQPDVPTTVISAPTVHVGQPLPMSSLHAPLSPTTTAPAPASLATASESTPAAAPEPAPVPVTAPTASLAPEAATASVAPTVPTVPTVPIVPTPPPPPAHYHESAPLSTTPTKTTPHSPAALSQTTAEVSKFPMQTPSSPPTAQMAPQSPARNSPAVPGPLAPRVGSPALPSQQQQVSAFPGVPAPPSPPSAVLSPAQEEKVEVPATQGEADDLSAGVPETKPRTLEQMMSLKPTDDERTEMSKKISWILRHGAKKVNVAIDEGGWIDIGDLLASEILGGTTEDRLIAIINESNSQKARYEIDADAQGRKRIRAISKSRRNAAAKVEREAARARERRRDDMGIEMGLTGILPPMDHRFDPVDPRGPLRDPTLPGGMFEGALRGPPLEMRDPRGDLRDAHLRGPAGPIGPDPRRVRDERPWWEREHERAVPSGGIASYQDEGPTYEQQIKAGFLPVYQGDRLVAMARDDETIRPGRRENPYKGKGDPMDFNKGASDRKGKGKGKPDGSKGFEKGGYGKDFGGGGGGKDHQSYGKGGDMDGDADDGKGDGKGYSRRPEISAVTLSRHSNNRIWRACREQDIIVRVGLGMETDIVGTLLSGSLVAQVGEDKLLKNGISRMFIETIEPPQNIKGWVTRSAEAAGGPVFFKPDRLPQPRERMPGANPGVSKGLNMGKGGGKMNLHDAKGKGRRPIGEGAF